MQFGLLRDINTPVISGRFHIPISTDSSFSDLLKISGLQLEVWRKEFLKMQTYCGLFEYADGVL